MNQFTMTAPMGRELNSHAFRASTLKSNPYLFQQPVTTLKSRDTVHFTGSNQKDDRRMTDGLIPRIVNNEKARWALGAAVGGGGISFILWQAWTHLFQPLLENLSIFGGG